jgi:hypothetical protein
MARPTKKEIAQKRKAELEKKREETLKLQEQLQKKIEKRKNKIELESNGDGVLKSDENSEINLNNNEDSNNDFSTSLNDDFKIPEEIFEELKSISKEEENDTPIEDFDPLKEKVIKRSYTDGNLGSSDTYTESDVEKIDKNNNSNSNDFNDSIINDNIYEDKNYSEPIIEEPIIIPKEPNISIEEEISGINSNVDSSINKDELKKDPVNPKLQDLSPSQKRKAVEKTADALIAAYANYVPIPFKYMSSFNMRKLEARHMNDELDKDMVVMDDGTTVFSYCENVNQQVEQTFVITKEMQDEIRDPLIDVLLENNAALTPTQRLILAVGGQIVQMGITSIQFMNQNKHAIETFKRFHQENKELKLKEEEKLRKEIENKIKEKDIQEEKMREKYKEKEKINEDEERDSLISVEEYLESE